MFLSSDVNKLASPAGVSPKESAPASGWRRYRRRPLVVGSVGVLLVLIGCFSIAGAPFILILEQINAGPGAGKAPVPWIILAGQLVFSALFVYIGSQLLKGKAWARWGFIALGALVLVIAFALFKPLYVTPGAVIYGVFTALLFQKKANQYF